MKTFIWLFAAIALLTAIGCKQVDSDPVTITFPLHYTATGDDGIIGQAAVAQIRMATSMSDLADNWSSCVIISEHVPWAPGVLDTVVVSCEVVTGVDYYIGIKLCDEAANWSLLSNVITRNFPDVTSPSPVGDFGFAD